MSQKNEDSRDENNEQLNDQQGAAGGPSPMAALMSVADNLASPEPVPQPNNPSPTSRSPPTTAATAQQRSASRGSQHSPNSSGESLFCKLRATFGNAYFLF